MLDEAQARIQDAMRVIHRRHQLIYDPRLLDGYDGFEGPLDHRKQLREILGRALSDQDNGFTVDWERTAKLTWKPPRRKRAPKHPEMIDLVLQHRHEDRHTRKRTTYRYGLTIVFGPPHGDPEADALTITRHGRTGTMPAVRGDDLLYTVFCELGNTEARVEAGELSGGFVLFFSVVPAWDEAFDAHAPYEGRVLEGALSRPKTLIRKSSPAIELQHTYTCEWTDWGHVPQTAPAGQRPLRGDTVADEGGREVKYLLLPVG